MSGHILLVDDERALVKGLSATLRHAGYRVTAAFDGDEALRKLAADKPDLVLLDLMLPGVDGLTLCRRIRQVGDIPVIMLTARAEDADKVVGLEVGADDYVTKPFNARELVARVRAVLRRAGKTPSDAETPIFRVGDLCVDPARRTATLQDRALDLPPREFDLLAFLAANPDRVWTRTELLDRVWGIEFLGDDRTVDSHVRRLREKIEDDPARPRRIVTSWGKGYMLVSPEFP